MAEQDIPEQNRVTTEPQRRALDEMSRQLVQKLNDMIAEQDARVKAFTAQQSSLSSLPNLVLPETRPIPMPPAGEAKTAEPPPVRRTPEPPPARERSSSNPPPLPFEIPAPAKKPAARKETGGCSGWMIAVGVFILFILLRSCN